MADLAFLSELNPQQREAATHGDGPLLVVAGAGSGKTKTLAFRVAVLLSRGVPPERILLLTFTRRAAEEMLRRAASVSQGSDKVLGRVWGGTFHATANRLLRIYAKAAKLSADFVIVDQSDAEDLMNVLRHEQGLSSKEKRFPRKATCLSIYSRCVNSQGDLKPILEHWYPWCAEHEDNLRRLFKAYTERKLAQNLLDYDDLLLYWSFLVEDQAVADSIDGRFDHVLVDEYQDTNPVQAAILRGMRRRSHNIMAVGDDAQSIYSFRSATVRNMLDFPQHFPGTTVVRLEQNYRSCEPILRTTNLLISQATQRYAKELFSTRLGGQKPVLLTCGDEDDQDEAVITRVLEHYEQGVKLREQAVLFRSNHHSSSLEVALTRRNIPYRKYGGLRFLESAHVKDLISFLRILENPGDQVAWFRILQLIEGVGPATAASAFEHVVKSGPGAAAIGTFHGPTAARSELLLLAQLLKELGGREQASPALDIERIIVFYKPLLERNHENPQVRLSDIQHLAVLARNFRSRRDFLTELALDPPTSTSDLAGPPSIDEDWLVLSTIHSAKGCEWDVVFLIHASDGFLPSDMAAGSREELEEELRLAYVAMTRPRNFLYVSWPLRYYHRPGRLTDRHSYAQLCRFISPQVRETMEEQSAGKTADPDAPADVAAKSSIAERLRGRWS